MARLTPTVPGKGGRKVAGKRPHLKGHSWHEWFDRFWKLSSSTLITAMLKWNCDPLEICCRLYFYSSPEPTEIEVLKTEAGNIGKRAYELALALLRTAAEADRLCERMRAIELNSEAEQIEKLSSNLHGEIAGLMNFWSLRQYGSKRQQGKNYHLLIVDEYVRSVTGSYHRPELANLAWAARAAHADDPDSVKPISSGALAKASKDMQRKNPQMFASVRRVAQNCGPWNLISELVESAWVRMFGPAK